MNYGIMTLRLVSLGVMMIVTMTDHPRPKTKKRVVAYGLGT